MPTHVPRALRAGLSAWLLCVALPAAAQVAPAGQPSPGARNGVATYVQRPPVVDGRLDDEAWRAAPLYDGFVQRELHEGQAVSERTEVRIVTDGEALYVGAWLFDREPGGIVPGEKIRDVSLDNSD